jgi:hypothetical protein
MPDWVLALISPLHCLLFQLIKPRDVNPSVIMASKCQQFKKEKQRLGSRWKSLGFLYPEMDTADVLIRQLAAQQCLTLFESTYRLIFGSQISAMEQINTHGPQSSQTLSGIFYETAKALYPDFYATYSFESWLSFLTRHEMVQKVDDRDEFVLALAGKDFLVWLVNNGLTREKAG